MNLSLPFIKKPIMTLMLMGAILILGAVSYVKLPVTDLPGVDFPMINISASYSGASPEVMARSVAGPLEKELAKLTGLKHIASQSSRGMTWISLMFDLNQNMDDLEKGVQAALKQAEGALPPDLDARPMYFKADAHQDAIIYLVLTSSSFSLPELYDYAHAHIEQRLARLKGVGKVEIHGSPYAVRISLNPELMAARGVSFEEVRGAIAQATQTHPLGRLDTPGRKFTLECPLALQSAADFAQMSLGKVKLKEIADVTDGMESEEIFHFVTKDQDTPAIIFAIQKQNDANAVQISKQIQALLPALTAELPETAHLQLWFDKAGWIEEAILDVEWSLVLSFALVLGVIYLSLGRLRETLVAGAALPLSIIGTLIVMQLLHFNLDLLSLLALTLAMGFVIDDAIVVLENIVRHREKGLTAWDAAMVGSKEIGFTVLSMTLSLVAVFIPMLFMQDIVGRLFREFSVTLAVSILVSGFVSLTLTPMLASRFSSPHRAAPLSRSRLFHLYQRSLNWCLNHKKTTLSFAVSVVICSFLSFRFLSVQLFPEEDRGFIWSFVQMPSGLAKKDMESYQAKLNGIVQEHGAVDSFVTLNFKDFQIYLIRLVPTERAAQAAVVTELQTQLNALPGTTAFMRGIQLISNQMGGFTRNNFQFVLRGADLDTLRAGAEALQAKLAQDPRFAAPFLDLKADDPKLEIALFEQLAERLQISRGQVLSLLQHAYAGGKAGHIEKNSGRYNVLLELGPQFQKNTAALSKLYLKTSTGSAVPLKAVASWKEGVGLQTIQHIDLLPAAILSFDVAKDTSMKEAFEQLKQIARETLPEGVSGKLEGLGEMNDSTAGDTALLLLLAFAAMYIILGILYESFIHPFTILSALPFALLGGVLTLLVFKEPLSLYGMVGFLLLIGIVKKNGIMMVDYALEQQRTSGKAPLEAIREACLVRFRPIMMTTVAAVMGAAPIAIGLGAGAETRRALGLVIAGGLLFSQMLTLYITPILYLYLEKLRGKKDSNSVSDSLK